MPISSLTRWTNLGLLCCLAAGCATGRGATASNEEGGGLKSLLQPKVSQASYEEIEEVPAKPKDEYALRLKFAEWMEDAGDNKRAEEQYRDIVKAKPKNVSALLGLARMDILAGRYPSAEEGLHRAERLAKNSPDVAATYGQFHAAQKDWDKAIESYNKAVQNDPDNDDYRYQLALTMVRAGRIEASLPHFAATVGDAAGHYNIGLILRENGDLAGAEEHLQLALRKRPDLEDAKQWLVEVRREQGKPTGLAPRAVANAAVQNAPANVVAPASASTAANPGRYPRPAGRPELTAQQREQLNNQL